MKQKIIAVIAAGILLLTGVIPAAAATTKTAVVSSGYIDNSSLTPPFRTDDQVKLEPANGGKLMSPDWVKTLILEEVNVAKASPNGRFSGMTYVLDHLQQTGVNGVWLTPIYDGKHYRNYGPATVDTYLTGELDYEKGWQVVADFVREAHKRNIRVFLDIVTWGANSVSAIYRDHPDWFDGYSDAYEGELYNWDNPELVDWFSKELVDIVHKTDIDGYRADCGIDYCGTELYRRVRKTLYDEGNYIILIGETIREGSETIFDFDEHSVDYELQTQGQNYIDGSLNIVSVTKTGAGLDTTARQLAGTAGQNRFYTSIVTCHDSQNYLGNGSYVPMAYASILSPFIPLWYIGEEWNNQYNSTGWLWANGISWKQRETNRDYYETIKAYIRIRRLYPEIFESFPLNHRDSNICAVETDHPYAAAKAYARYGAGKGILVIPNYGELNDRFEVTVPYEDMGLSASGTYRIVNLLTGKRVAVGTPAALRDFGVTIPEGQVAVYVVESAPASEATVFVHSTVKPDDTASNVIAPETSEQTPETDETETEEESTPAPDKSEDKESDNAASVKPEKDKVQPAEKSPVWPWVLTGVGVLAVLAVAAVLLVRATKKK